MVKIEIFEQNKVVYHAALGHVYLMCSFTQDKELYYGAAHNIGDTVVRSDKAENFKESCLNFKVGQAVKYNGSEYIITALEPENNRIVTGYLKNNKSIAKIERFALPAEKCTGIKHSQLRIAVVNELNEVVKEMGPYEPVHTSYHSD